MYNCRHWNTQDEFRYRRHPLLFMNAIQLLWGKRFKKLTTAAATPKNWWGFVFFLFLAFFSLAHISELERICIFLVSQRRTASTSSLFLFSIATSSIVFWWGPIICKPDIESHARPILYTHLLIFIYVPLKLSPSAIYHFEKKKHLHSPTNSNQLQQLNLRFFFFIIGFFFSRTEKKNYYWFWFYCGYWISWNQFRIKSRKYWYSVQRSFENFVLFYLPFPAQFFVDVKKSCFIKKENIIERGRPWLSRPEAKSPVA